MDIYFEKENIHKILLVCGNSISCLKINLYFETLKVRKGIEVIRFSNFQPNPCYESVEEGVEVYQKNECECIVAVGGGSAIDVAKCIKLFVNMPLGAFYLREKIVQNNIPFIVFPTTAGTGSEATRFAVIYYKGEKQSVTDNSCIPQMVVFDSSVLSSLPLYQKKVTMLDAFCHAIEAYWSINSTEESKAYSIESIKLILTHQELYLLNDEKGYANMFYAANLAGRAINITQTTAGHAMSYKLTGIYHIAHGHAVALCVSKLWRYMLNNLDKCMDKRGKKYLKNIFEELAQVMGCETSLEAAEFFEKFVENLGLIIPTASDEEINILKKSVNQERLKNNPVRLEEETIEKLYRDILQWTKGGKKNEN